MGVYQSATEPKVSRRGVNYIAMQSEIKLMGERGVIKILQKQHRIPRKVRPSVEHHDWGVKFRFEWWAVETYN